MLRGLRHLTWLEIKIFVREPLGVIGTVVVPVALFMLLGRVFRSQVPNAEAETRMFGGAGLPVMVAVLIAITMVLSLVTIIAIYREGGILKRLRATPLRPETILAAHVLVKLLFTTVTLALMVVAGRRFYPIGTEVPLLSFTLALLFCTLCIMSMGFVIASVVPTARFAQPIGSLILYPMLGLSGLFVAIDSLPGTLQLVARALPLTYAVSLLSGIWRGDGWGAHLGDAAILALMFLGFSAISARVFRWA